MNTLPKELYYYFKVFGILPFKYFPSKNGKNSILFCSKSYLWVVLLFLFQTFSIISIFGYEIYSLISGHPVHLINNVDVLTATANCFTVILVSVVGFISCSKHWNKLLKIYCTLELFQTFTKRNVQNTKTYVMTVASVFIIPLLFVPSYWLQKDKSLFLLYIPFLIQAFIEAAVTLQYYSICHVLTASFIVVNKEIQQEINLQSCTMLLKDFQGLLPTIKTVKDGSGSLARFKALMNLFWLLCDTAQETNEYYNMTLLIAVFLSFFRITMALYKFLMLIWTSFDAHEVTYAVMIISWIAVHVTQLTLLVYPSTAVTSAADETAPMVCKLINRDLDPDVKRQMEIFLLQLLRHNAKFSALGFFEVKTQILTSIASSVTTYIVIIIQFKTDEN